MLCVKKDDLAQLAAEISRFKQNLPKLCNKNLVSAQVRALDLEEENARLRDRCNTLTRQVNDWKMKYEGAILDTQTEKRECLRLRCELQDSNQQLTQQTDYCSSMGNACCTLLWRVSRCEESVQAILAGTKVEEFLLLVSSTLHSYVSAYKDEWPLDDTDEAQFSLALAGIITNIAATAYGRDYLITRTAGKQVLETYITVLSEAPAGKSARLKNLVVMCLYNVSINRKGIQYINAQKGLLSLAAWILQGVVEKVAKEVESGETDSELRANSLRLIQSLVLDDGNCSTVHELDEVLPGVVLSQLSQDPNKEIRELVIELLSDLSRIRESKLNE